MSAGAIGNSYAPGDRRRKWVEATLSTTSTSARTFHPRSIRVG
jgi:hypothetical protein